MELSGHPAAASWQLVLLALRGRISETQVITMFGLDPQSVIARINASSQTPHIPTLGESMQRGMLGFTLVSLAGFAPWVLAGRWFYRHLGEAGLYGVCALIFIGFSGLLLHRLIIGPGSLVRFYKLFSLAFLAYAITWTVAWITLARSAGGITAGVIGSLAGISMMGALLAWGFKAPAAMLKIIAALFAANLAGYFIGEWAYHGALALKEGNAFGLVLTATTRALLSKTAWGLFYGLGFGAGLGFAFHTCQAKTRQLLAQQN